MTTPARAFPPLAEVLVRARTAALPVVEARGAAAVARASGVGARASSFGNPYVEVLVDHGRFTQDVQVQGALFLPIEIAGQRSARIDESDALVLHRQQALLDTEARAMGGAVAAYGWTLVAASRVRLIEAAERESSTELEWVSARATAGDATAVDRSLAEAEVARWGQLRAEAEIGLVRARGMLSITTGLPSVDAPDGDAPTDPPAARCPSAEACARSALAQAPALRSLEAEIKLWDAARERAQADRSPPINAIVLGGRGDYGEARVGAGLAWTFPVVRRNEGEIARARAEQTRASASRGATALAIEARARAAFEAYQDSRAAVGRLDLLGLPAAVRLVEAAEAALRAGKVDLARVLIARRDLATARGRRLDLVETAWRALADLTALTGEAP